MEIVSRRTLIAFSICRSDHPSRPSAIACCFFSSFKTLLTRTEDNFPPSTQCPESLSLAGFQVITAGRFWVFTEGEIARREVELENLDYSEIRSTQVR